MEESRKTQELQDTINKAEQTHKRQSQMRHSVSTRSKSSRRQSTVLLAPMIELSDEEEEEGDQAKPAIEIEPDNEELDIISPDVLENAFQSTAMDDSLNAEDVFDLCKEFADEEYCNKD